MSVSWFEKHPRKSMLMFYFVLLVMFEGVLRVLAFYGVIAIVHYPTSNAQSRFLGDINEDFGVWHYPDRKVQHRSPCFDVVYETNSYGARDIERSKSSNGERRVVVLGDSFVEGVGVLADERMTNIAEKNTGIEFLNFGVSGDFGSVQEWILYRELAQNFEHSDVAIFFLPDNDFKDSSRKNFPEKRYRPYLIKNDKGEFEVRYTVNFSERFIAKELSPLKKFKRELYNRIYLINVIRHLRTILENSDAADVIDEEYRNRVAYDDFSELDFEKLIYSYDQIIKLVGSKNVSIFVIPREADLNKYISGENQLRVVKKLEEFAGRYENVKVVDLLPNYLDYAKKHSIGFNEFFHSCDGHWSKLGNEVAGNVLIGNVQR